MLSFVSRTACLLAVLLVSAAPSPANQPADDVVRDDWYFRESLAAIRDWEAILQRLQREDPERSFSATLPVPSGGQPVIWPNPCPRMLLPAADRERVVEVRLAGGQVEVSRSGSTGQDARQTLPAGQEILGYKHPGGGAKDQWYHVYDRGFDQLAVFRARPARIAVEFRRPWDPRRGPNELSAQVKSAAAEPLVLKFALSLHLPERSRVVGEERVEVPPGESRTLRMSFELASPGGGLLVLSIIEGATRFEIPFLTHVEDVPAVLRGVEQMLADEPDTRGSERLAGLVRRVEARDATATDRGATWRECFAEASRLRDDLLRSRIDFDAMLFVKRKPYDSEQPFMDAHHLPNRPGGAIYRLAPARPDGRLTAVVDSLGEGVYRDLCLDWDAGRLLFAFGNGSDHWDSPVSYHVYEASADGTGLRQLTTGPKNDCEPFYLPNGQIGFTSDRSEHIVMCGGDRHAPTLFVMEGDGSAIRQLSFNVFNDFNPTVLPDGRILYSRWEYNERSVTSLHNPFTMNADGTMVAPYYGNATIRPNVVMFPRPVPGSRKIMALFTAHHGQTHGSVGLIDARRGIDGPGPLAMLAPGVPLMGERAEDSQAGWFSDPQPLSETTFLCAYTPTVQPWLEASWAIYVADRHGNLALVWRDPAISCFEPVPLVARPRPHAMPPATSDTESTNADAALLLANTYIGLPGVPTGSARYLRIIEDVPRKGVMDGGVIVTSLTPVFTVKRVLGTVPIERDGSAYFTVPANRNIYFQVLDERQREIQRMRSVVCLKPGETRGCIGCHEPRNQAPPAARIAAAAHPPSQPVTPPWGDVVLSYLRDIQPLINAKCVSCHAHDRGTNRVILTDDLTDQFCVGYEELVPYLSVASAMRWDHPDDVLPRPPYTYGSKVSALTKLLEEGHHGVELSESHWRRLFAWIDANGVYYDRYETGSRHDRRIFAGREAEAIEAIARRRCASCHGENEGRGDTWWLSLNRRDASQSRALLAPLARSAGGWGRCDGPVFADTSDPDYQALRSAFRSIRDTLEKDPRADLLSIRGTGAESQEVDAILSPRPQRGE